VPIRYPGQFCALRGLNFALMLIFGWMGSTCLDEWTMAVSGVAMSSGVFLAGGGAWSLDSLIERSGWGERHRWIAWVFSGPLPPERVKAAALALEIVLEAINGATWRAKTEEP
jgi:hypothetical protein